MVDIVTLETPGLGNRSSVVTDGDVAVVVDPPRDIDRVEAVVAERGVTVTHVLETHVHNDYVTGGLALARRLGAAYVLSADEELAFEHHGMADGDQLRTGSLRIRAVHTPGHTPTHLAYVVSDASRMVAVFTGGSMLYGTVGRTDLISPDRTHELTRAQYRSVRRLAAVLPDPVEVKPTHGFGSFCSSAEGTDVRHSTIADEREHNVALTTPDEDRFVELIIGGLGAYPRYYAHMGLLNRAGPQPVDLSPAPDVDASELAARIGRGEWVVDVRPRAAFAADHLAGTVNVELDDPLATYVGWTLPWGTAVTLLGGTADDVARAQRMLARIGIDRPAGRVVGGPDALDEGPRRSYPTASFSDLARVLGRDDVAVLDVRRDGEWAAGHVAGAHRIPLPDLPARVGELDADRTWWTYCASGYRSAIAASLLDRAGRSVVLVDDDVEAAADAGVPMEAAA